LNHAVPVINQTDASWVALCGYLASKREEYVKVLCNQGTSRKITHILRGKVAQIDEILDLTKPKFAIVSPQKGK
jgi:hypothetical protein